MSYLLLIVEPVGQRAERTPEQGREAYGAMLRYAESLNERGLLQRAESLKSDAEGVRLRVRDGERSVVDGPFAEAKGNDRRLLPAGLRHARGSAGAGRRMPGRRLGHRGSARAGPCFL